MSPPQRAAHQASTVTGGHLSASSHTFAPRRERKWRRSDSNRRPPACKAGALPLSYAPAGDGVQQLHPNSKRATQRRRQRDTALRSGAAQVASPPLRGIEFQLRRNPMVGQGGLEPPTPRLSSVCSNQLSYWPRTRGVAQSGEGCAVGAHRSPCGPQPGAPARPVGQRTTRKCGDRSAHPPPPHPGQPANGHVQGKIVLKDATQGTRRIHQAGILERR